MRVRVRMTVTLDDDVNQMLRETMSREGKTFKETVNMALRKAYQSPPEKPTKPRGKVAKD